MVGEPSDDAMPWHLDVLTRLPLQILSPDPGRMPPLTRLLERQTTAPAVTRADVPGHLGVDPARILEAESVVERAFEDFRETLPTDAAAGLRRGLEAYGSLPASVMAEHLTNLGLDWSCAADVVRLLRIAFQLDVLAAHLTAHLPDRAAMRTAHTAQLRTDRARALRLKLERDEHARTLRLVLEVERDRTHRRPPDRVTATPEAVVLASAPRHAPPVSGRVARAAA